MSEDKLLALSRSRAKDPVQEHLRERKHQWNDSSKDLIEAFKKLKKGINGFPVPDLGLPKTKITESVPEALDTLTKQLRDHFIKSFQELDGIINEQRQYAEFHANRRREKELGKLKQEQAPKTSSVVSEEIIKEGANIFSRLWTYIKTPFLFSDKDRWQRVRLLRTAAQLEDLLVDIESALVSRGNDSIPTAVYTTKDAVHILRNGIIEPLIALQKIKEDQAPQLPQPGQQQVELPEEHQDLYGEINEFRGQVLAKMYTVAKMQSEIGASQQLPNNIRAFLKRLINDTTREINRFMVEKNTGDIDKIKSRYNEVNQRYNELEKAFNQAMGKVSKASSVDINNATNPLMRSLKRQLLKLWETRDSSLRLAADKDVRNARKELNEFMNGLQEKNAQLDQLVNKLVFFSAYFGALLEKLSRLADIYNNYIKLQRFDKGKQLPVINEADKNALVKMKAEIELSLAPFREKSA